MDMVLRCSRPEDVPRLRELWVLAFGDGEDYMDNFFAGYYRPERVLVLEEAGVVQAMTAWFDMPLVGLSGSHSPAAYLYAVATHPDCRGRGYAGQLLAFGDSWLAQQGFVCVTTVPARPDLHGFFAANGFAENFVLAKSFAATPGEGPEPVPVDGAEYNRLRRQALQGLPYVDYSDAAMAYQQGACTLSGGGLYRVGSGCACVEISDGTVFIKELLVDREQYDPALAALARRHPAESYEVRTPWPGVGKREEFAMVKWLGPVPADWDSKQAYLGLGFD